MLAVFDEMQNDDIVAIASADTDYLTLIEFLLAVRIGKARQAVACQGF